MTSTDHASLAIALKTRLGVVLAADTRVIRHPEGMNYTEEGFSKLSAFGEGCAAALTGDVGLMFSFLKRAQQEGKAFSYGKSPYDTTMELADFFRKLYLTEFANAPDPKDHTVTTALFVGHGTFANRRQSFIYKMELNEYFFFREEPRHSPAGQHKHGGLYYLNRFYREDMTLKEAAFLAFLCIREVSSLDGSVGPGVEIIACSDDGAAPVPLQWLKDFRLQHENAHLQMTNWFSIKE
jgi:20S proteasome alpha/beta subunit